MGIDCLRPHIPEDEIVKRTIIPDLILEPANGTHEAIFESMEDLNILKFYSVNDFIQLYLTFFPDGKVTEVRYSVFIDKKILKNVQITDKVGNDESLQSKIKEYNLKVFQILFKAFKTYYKTYTNEKYKEEHISVEALLPLAFLYCHGRVDTKLELIFDRFAVNGETIQRTTSFNHFIFCLLALPAGVFLFTLKSLADEDEAFSKQIAKFDFQTVFETYQIKDAIHASNVFMDELFVNSPSLNLKDFKSLVSSNKDFQILLSPGAVRAFLEKNNI